MATENRRSPARKPKSDDVYATFKNDSPRLTAFAIREARIIILWAMSLYAGYIGGPLIVSRMVGLLAKYVS